MPRLPLVMPRLPLVMLCALAATPLAAQPVVIELEPDDRSPGCRFGEAIAFVDDLDGDGLREVLVGASRFTSSSSTIPGCAYVFDGRSGEPLHSLDADGNATFGRGVSAAGDITGDGVGDFAVHSYSDVRLFDGSTGAHLRTIENRGAALGLALVDDFDGDGMPELAVGEGASQSQGSAAHIVAGSDGSLLHTISSVGGFPARELGLGLASIGDVDGDGVADLAIGDGGWISPDPDVVGAVHVVSGATRAHLYTVFPIPTPGDFVRHGRFGENWTLPIASLPDVDGDGVPDFAVGASDESIESSTEGRVYVFSGTTGTLLYRVEGEQYGGLLGRSVAGIPDIDGDGAGDLVVGEAGGGALEPFREGPGAVRLVSGASGAGLGVVPAPESLWGIDHFGEAVDAYVDASGTLRVVASAPGADVGDANEVGRGRVFLFAGMQAVAAEPGVDAPASMRLDAPFPNPARAGATVRYHTAAAGDVRLVAYDVLGREAALLVDEQRPAGEHRAEIPSDLPVGPYVLRLETASGATARRLIVAR